MEATLIGAEELKGMTISAIARVIQRDWTKPNAKGKRGTVYFGAVPYLDAMKCVDNLSDRYGCEDGENQVRYFLANAQTYRGEQAKLIKAELNRRINGK